MVQSASPRMAVSLAPVISGRAGGATGRERAKTNARWRETLPVQCQAGFSYGTRSTAEICCAARVVRDWDEPLEPPSQGGSVGFCLLETPRRRAFCAFTVKALVGLGPRLATNGRGDGVESGCGLVVEAVHEVAVAVDRDLDGRVSESGLDRLGVFSCGDQPSGVGVSQVVDSARRPN
jgi:hypothetical protein